MLHTLLLLFSFTLALCIRPRLRNRTPLVGNGTILCPLTSQMGLEGPFRGVNGAAKEGKERRTANPTDRRFELFFFRSNSTLLCWQVNGSSDVGKSFHIYYYRSLYTLVNIKVEMVYAIGNQCINPLREFDFHKCDMKWFIFIFILSSSWLRFRNALLWNELTAEQAKIKSLAHHLRPKTLLSHHYT